MPYDVYLQSSFDSQLQFLPGSVIDWQPTRSRVRGVLAGSALAPLLCSETRVTPWRVPLRYTTEPSSPVRSLAWADRAAAQDSGSTALLASSQIQHLLPQSEGGSATASTAATGSNATQSLAGRIAQDVAVVQAEVAGRPSALRLPAGTSSQASQTSGVTSASSALVEGRPAGTSGGSNNNNNNVAGSSSSAGAGSSLPAVLASTQPGVSSSTSVAATTTGESSSSSTIAMVMTSAAVKDMTSSSSAGAGSVLHASGRGMQDVGQGATSGTQAAPSSTRLPHLTVSVHDEPCGVQGVGSPGARVSSSAADSSGAVVTSEAAAPLASPLTVSSSAATNTPTTTTTTTSGSSHSTLSATNLSPALQLPCGHQERGVELVCGSYGEARVYQKHSFVCTAGLSAMFGLSQVARHRLRPVQEVQAEALRLVQAAEVQNAASNAASAGTVASSSPPQLTAQGDEAQQLLVVGEVRRRWGLKVSEIGQLAWYWGRLRWSGVLNVRALPWSGRQTGGKAARTPWLPVCEYVMRTPWTMWAVQRDASVTKASAFLTLYQTTARHAKRATESSTSTSEETEQGSRRLVDDAKGDAEVHEGRTAGSRHKDAKRHGEKVDAESSSSSDAKKGGSSGSSTSAVAEDTAHEVADKAAGQGKARSKKSTAEQSTTSPSTTSGGAKTSHKASHEASKAGPEQAGKQRHEDTDNSSRAKHKAEREQHTSVTTQDNTSTQPSAVQHRVIQQQQELHVSSDVVPTTHVPMPSLPWWRLRALRIGAGVAAKNDLARGINLYWGCSAELGNGLSFAAHMDVLRRLCCSLVSSRGALTLAVRLRVNLITYSGTALDAGLAYVPWAALPNTTLRLTSSAAGHTVGLQVQDITHEWGGAWLAKHKAWSAANLSDDEDSEERSKTSREQQLAAAAAAAASSSSSISTSEVEGRWFSLWAWWPTMPWSSTAAAAAADSSSNVNSSTATRLHDKVGSKTGDTTTIAAEPDRTDKDMHGMLSVAHARAVVQRWLPPVTASRWWPQRALDLTHRTQVTATTQARSAWRRVRRLDWLEHCLDRAHVDVAVGVAHDPARHGTRGWGTFLILSAH